MLLLRRGLPSTLSINFSGAGFYQKDLTFQVGFLLDTPPLEYTLQWGAYAIPGGAEIKAAQLTGVIYNVEGMTPPICAS